MERVPRPFGATCVRIYGKIFLRADNTQGRSITLIMIKTYFGLPGCGKTTLLTYFALKGVRNKNYKNVYSTVRLKIPGVTYIDAEVIGKYELRDCLILVDEGMIYAAARQYKEFDKEKQKFFAMHRHFNVDIVLFTQRWDGMDIIIRSLSDRVYYIYKTPLFGRWWTYSYRIPYGIIIPKKDESNAAKVGEIIQGYHDANTLTKILKKRLFRPKYYKYFDSWETYRMPKLPNKYVKYQVKEKKNSLKEKIKKLFKKK